MTDLSQTIAPKSDQLNSDDLISGPITIKITKISANPGSPEQPISMSFEGDGGKPYKPCKSMRRVLVNTWGADGAKYPGRMMTLYRDPTVKFGGFEVGGIRISHMSDIEKPVTMALTASKASRKPFTVQPLRAQKSDPLAEMLAPNPETLELARAAAGGGTDVFKTWYKNANKEERADVQGIMDELKATGEAADKEQAARDEVPA